MMPKGKHHDDDNALMPLCSFCGKYERDGVRLIAGPRAKICNECAQLCVDIFADGHTTEPQNKRSGLPLKERIAIVRQGQVTGEAQD